MKKLAFQTVDLVKTYKNNGTMIYANNGISLEIPKGTIFGIFGPNGAGKTTLIKQLMGLICPTKGSIFLLGIDIVKNPNLIPHYVGYCGQNLYHLWRLTALELLVMTGRLRGMKKDQAYGQAQSLMSMVGFEKKMNRVIRDFSGGELRIVSVFSALMGKSPIIILDEPTSGLDPVARQNVWQALFHYQAEVDATIILVTHNVLEAEKVVDNIAIIDEGNIIAQGKPTELKNELKKEVSIEIEIKPLTNIDFGMSDLEKVRERVYCYKGDLENREVIINQVIEKIGMENIEDLRISPLTLEDYYVQKVGKKWK
ncbi:MAG: ABC transporter ATP-binding protein [Halanaerobiales bacterium]|nr:ABC transporter ATP-binding protein [Halanaerobiales bacterium]